MFNSIFDSGYRIPWHVNWLIWGGVIPGHIPGFLRRSSSAVERHGRRQGTARRWARRFQTIWRMNFSRLNERRSCSGLARGALRCCWLCSSSQGQVWGWDWRLRLHHLLSYWVRDKLTSEADVQCLILLVNGPVIQLYSSFSFRHWWEQVWPTSTTRSDLGLYTYVLYILYFNF